MLIRSFAKVNLMLRIKGKRKDDYHEIDTLMHRISLCDYIQIKKNDELIVRTSNNVVGSKDNLVYKIIKLYKERYNLEDNFYIYIYKNIPAGAGLGGGSSNSAAVIKKINDLYSLASAKELIEIASQIGSDIPFFLGGSNQRATGIGTDLKSIDINRKLYFVLARNSRGISTSDVYLNLRTEDINDKVDIDKFILYLRNKSKIIPVVNHLEKPAFRIDKSISDLKYKMKNIIGNAAMSGSGNTVFSIVNNLEDAINFQEKIKNIATWTNVAWSSNE